MIGYCVKCRQKRELQAPEEVVTKNGKHAARGTCPVCSTPIWVLG